MKGKTLMHHGARVVRTVRTTDSRLSAVDPGKLAALGQIWDGVSKRLDEMSSSFAAIDTPLGVGRTLHAEQLDRLVDLGRAWLGVAAQALGAADKDDDWRPTSNSGDESDPDALGRKQAREHAESLRRGTSDNALGRMNAATRTSIQRMQSAIKAAAQAGMWSGRKSATHDAPLPPVSNATTQERVAAINLANKAFWAARHG